MFLDDIIRCTIDLLAEVERNAALNQRLNRQKIRIISSHNEIDPRAWIMGSVMTINNSQGINGPPDRPKIGSRSDLSDLLQRLSVLTAIKDRCAAMASEIAEEQISEDNKGNGIQM